tara:strand:+ start:1405 stop:1686 length:282 start_codon:yes stop_codon:yes gene_type:complete
MSKFIVSITIEFDKKPNDQDVRSYLTESCKNPGGLRWDLDNDNIQIFDAQDKQESDMSDKEIVQYYGQIWENVKHMKSYVKELKQRYIKETQS